MGETRSSKNYNSADSEGASDQGQHHAMLPATDEVSPDN